MIYLKKIYSEPEGLFDEVVFSNGINIIMGRYDTIKQNKQSLNSTGKTTLVKLIDFCLLSSYNKNSSIYKAKQITDSFYITLEFKLDQISYVVKRTTQKSNKPLFGKKNGVLKEYDIKDLKVIFNNMFFGEESSNSKFTFRQLINLFIRDEKTGYDKDPINYMSGPAKANLISYNLHLLGIENELSDKSYKLRKEIKDKKKLIKELESFLRENYEIRDIAELNTKLYFLVNHIEELETRLKQFELQPSYEDIEDKINNITKEIKQLLLENYMDKQKIEQYEKSFEINIDVSVEEISELYGEIKEEFGRIVSKTLGDAIIFRKKLVESRKKFLSKEITVLGRKIEEKTKKVKDLDESRSNLYNYLNEVNAINDLQYSIETLSTQKEQISELNGKLKIYNDLRNKIVSLEKEEAANNVKVNEFIDEIRSKIMNLRGTFLDIYSKLYSNEQKGQFNIIYNDNLKNDYRVKITALTDDGAGWGKGRGCILTYDLTILMNAINKSMNMPAFLIHDGVFNGVDINQWTLLMNYLYELEEKQHFQYIFTINESETNIDLETRKNISSLEFDINDKVIAEYTESNKIFKTDF